mgnify:CR=1 FL=1
MNINVGWFIAAFAAYFIINIVVSLRVSKGTSGISGFALGQVCLLYTSDAADE